MSVPRRSRRVRRQAEPSRNCDLGVSVAWGAGPSWHAGSADVRAAAAGADNKIGDVGAAALAEGVKASRTLTELHLYSECSITF
jgi:hypothetical protein